MQKRSKLKVFLLMLGIIAIIPCFSFESLDSNQINRPISEENLNLSSGTWDPVINKLIIGTPHHIFIEDVNNDGLDDIIATCSNHDNISILLWNTTSRDWDAIYKEVGENPSYFFVGDANNDGFNDIAVSNVLTVNITILLWNETISDWDDQIKKPVGWSPYDIFIGDVNADGYNDILTSIDNAFSILFWNESSGVWDAPIVKPAGGFPEEVYLGDANNDGYNDIISINEFEFDCNVTVDPWNDVLKDWDPQIILNAGEDFTDAFVEDVNNDGKNDIVVCNSFHDIVSILLWNDTISNWNDRITIKVGDTPLPNDSPLGVYVEDVNNDNLNDIVTANYEANTVSIFLWNNAIGDWEDEITKNVGTGPISIFVGDANNDGYNDIVTANYDSNYISILLWHEESASIIPGYDIFFLLIIIGAISAISIKKLKRNSNKI